MKRIIYTFVLLTAFFSIGKAQNVEFKFQAGTVMAGAPKIQMESNISQLLTILNNAGNAGDTLLTIPKGIMTTDAELALDAFWSNMHFVIDEEIVIQPLLNDAYGFEVRQIPITLIPLDNSFEGNKERELTINLSSSGKISGVIMALSNTEIRSFLTDFKGVTDYSRRLEILNFVEKFRQFYIEKNIEGLEKVFADDALIITGTVMKQQTMSSLTEKPEIKVKYRKEDKPQYINRLRNSIFKNNKYIEVKFDKFTIVQCEALGKENFYGVTLHQDWSSIRYNDSKATANRPSYHDEGWLFLLWEFHDDGTPPVIHVRTWQPDELISSGIPVIDMFDFKF